MKRCNCLCALPSNAGSVLPVLAVAMTAIIGTMGISLDIGNVMVAQAELRNAADAAALSGAAALSNPWINGQPDFVAAKNRATTALQNLRNESNGDLVVGTDPQVSLVSAGGLDLRGAGSGSAFKTWNNTLLPAVRVELHKSGGNSVVQSFFARVFGIASFSPAVVSTVVGGYSPQTADPGQLIPIAIPQCVYNNFWDPVSQTPKLVPPLENGTKICSYLKNQDPCPSQVSNSPYVIRLDSQYGITYKGVEVCPSQSVWTGFSSQNPSVSSLENWIDHGVDQSISIDQVLNANGAKTALYSYVSSKIPSAAPREFVGLAPVVADITPGVTAKVSAFACVAITASSGGSDKYVQMHLLPRTDSRCPIKGSGASSNPYVRVPPQIVQ